MGCAVTRSSSTSTSALSGCSSMGLRLRAATSGQSSSLPDVLAVSTFEWIKALVAPILAFCALIIAAAIAAATAKTRQAQQLDQDSERLRQQLDHDSERLATELEHERRMGDLAA